MHTADLSFADHGSLWIITPESEYGTVWLDAHISEDAQRWGKGVACEHRYVGDILMGAREDGLAVVRA